MFSHHVPACRHLLILTSVLLVGGSLRAASRDWENEQVIGINKEPGRVFSLPFASRDAALGKSWEESSRVRLLNGTWKFHYAKRHDLRSTDFFHEGFDTSSWNDIELPASWQTQGFGVPIYVNQ